MDFSALIASRTSLENFMDEWDDSIVWAVAGFEVLKLISVK